MKKKCRCKPLWRHKIWRLGLYMVAMFLIIVTCTRTVAVSTHNELLDKRLEYLGRVRVTNYTHYEGGRLTASGYVLQDRDAGRVCAVGRDWWGGRVKPFDTIWLKEFNQTCVAMDTMAIANSRGLKQTTWVDIYYTDRTAAMDFGIQHAEAYLISGM